MSTIFLHKKIKELRLKKKWSQKALVKKSGVPYHTLIKIEQGVSKEPSIQTIAKIAKALNISIDKLVGL